MYQRLLCWIFYLILFTRLGNCESKRYTSLYRNGSIITVVNRYNFYSNVLDKNYFSLTLFYTHWCGDCIRFAPKMKKFAKEIYGWKDLIQIKTINCAEEFKLCADLRLKHFPSTSIIPPRTKTLNNLLPNYKETKEELYNETLTIITSDSQIVEQYSLNSINIESKKELCQTVSSFNSSKEQFLVFETKPTFFGVKIILDLSNLTNYLQVHSFHGKQELIHSLFDVHANLPIIAKIHPEECTFSNLQYSKNGDEEALRQNFTHFFKEKYHYVEKNDIDTNDTFYYSNHNLSYVDLHNALRYMFVTEIPANIITKSFDEKQVTVVKQIFSVISKYFPFENENVKRLFKRMNIWLANQKNTFSLASYQEALKISDGFLKPLESWRHCNGSTPYLRGYPCGLWSLFHTMTINEYNITKNSDNPPHEVLRAMKAYILTFFTCLHCQRHFAIESKDMESKLIYPNSSVIWLWQTHNRVNHRLSGDATDDPFHSKIQFPSKKMCNSCFVRDNIYNQSKVLEFLTNYYSKKSIQNGQEKLFVSKVLISLVFIFMYLIKL